MGNLWIKVNYTELSEKMNKVSVAEHELQEFLDEAAGTETTQPAVCERNDCPHRWKDKGGK